MLYDTSHFSPQENNRTCLTKAHSVPGQSDDKDETEKKKLIEVHRCGYLE